MLTPHETGKRHAEDGIMFYPQGQKGPALAAEYAKGYMEGIPATRNNEQIKAKYVERAKLVMSGQIRIGFNPGNVRPIMTGLIIK